MSFNFSSFDDDRNDSINIFNTSSSSSADITPQKNERKGNSESKKFFESFVEFGPEGVVLKSQINLGPGLIKNLGGISVQLKSFDIYNTTFDYHLSVDPKFGSQNKLHAATLMDMMYHRFRVSKLVRKSEKIVIYDVRYRREYNFGHIRYAINGMGKEFFIQNDTDVVNRKKHDDLFGEKPTDYFVLNGKTKLERKKEKIQERFGNDITDIITRNIVNDMTRKINYLARDNNVVNPKIAFVFHCEFSSHRAPNFLKRVNDEISKIKFPSSKVQYRIFILSQGYSFFYEYWLLLSKIERTTFNKNYADFVSGPNGPIQQVGMSNIFNGPYDPKLGVTDIRNVKVYKRLSTELNVSKLVNHSSNLAVYSSPDKNRLVIAYYDNSQKNYVFFHDMQNPNEKYFVYNNIHLWVKDYSKVDTSCFAGTEEFKKNRKAESIFKGRGSRGSRGGRGGDRSLERPLFFTRQQQQKQNRSSSSSSSSGETSLFKLPNKKSSRRPLFNNSTTSESDDDVYDSISVFSPDFSPMNNSGNNSGNNNNRSSSNSLSGDSRRVLDFDNTSPLNSELKKMSTSYLNDFIC